MIRATKVLPAGDWLQSTLTTDTVALDFDMRHRRRLQMTGLRGLAFLLDLPKATTLRNGDGLQLEDGRVVLVKAAPEPLAKITAAGSAALMRIAWHIGNRHLPAALSADAILIRRDHVIEAMVAGLGATVTHVDEPFDPEGGAYDTHHHHHHERHEHDDRTEDEARGPKRTTPRCRPTRSASSWHGRRRRFRSARSLTATASSGPWRTAR